MGLALFIATVVGAYHFNFVVRRVVFVVTANVNIEAVTCFHVF